LKLALHNLATGNEPLNLGQDLSFFDFAGQYGRSKDLLDNDEVYQGLMEDQSS
jgi:hypothetical protein